MFTTYLGHPSEGNTCIMHSVVSCKKWIASGVNLEVPVLIQTWVTIGVSQLAIYRVKNTAKSQVRLSKVDEYLSVFSSVHYGMPILCI